MSGSPGADELRDVIEVLQVLADTLALERVCLSRLYELLEMGDTVPWDGGDLAAGLDMLTMQCEALYAVPDTFPVSWCSGHD